MNEPSADIVSTRALTPMRRLLYAIATPVGLAVLRFWWWSCKVVHVQGEEHFRAALASAPSMLPCYWHQHELFCARWLLDRQSEGLKLGFLISPSVDGEVPAEIARRLGAAVIRGSSTRTGARALRDYYQLLVKDQVSPVITPDGPSGPRFKFKPGGIVLAQISGRPLLPMAFAASSAWLVSWDKFVIPKPFSRIVIAIGEPVSIPRTLKVDDASALAPVQADLEQRLLALYRQAKQALEKGG
ncbi:MAG: lysophospholipid acyltransferase family protein [Steroidobacteraceae bacterium]